MDLFNFDFNNENTNGGNSNFGNSNVKPKTLEYNEKRKEVRIIKGSPKANKASVFIMNKTESGEIIFQMAKQAGTTQDKNGRLLPKFDYEKKVYFSLSDQEAGTIISTINKLMLMGKAEKITLPHQTAKEPKNIIFDFSIYDGKAQCGVSVLVSKDNSKNVSIFLSEGDLIILKENLKSQITL